MAYDPEQTNLSEEDWQFLEMISDMFLNARLKQSAQVVFQGHLLGKLLAEAEARGIPWEQMAVAGLPVDVEVTRTAFALTAADTRAIEFSRQHAAEYITDMSDRSKAAIRETVTAAQAEKLPAVELGRELFAEYGELNRDWRRIALTETATATTNGYLATLPDGELVVGDSSVDACPWCLRHIHNRAYRLLSDPPEEVTDELSWSSVWPGKTNVGRSQYPKKADGSARSVAELWHPCIPSHPHCRCRWRRFNQTFETMEPGSNLVVDKVNLFNT